VHAALFGLAQALRKGQLHLNIFTRELRLLCPKLNILGLSLKDSVHDGFPYQPRLL